MIDVVYLEVILGAFSLIQFPSNFKLIAKKEDSITQKIE